MKMIVHSVLVVLLVCGAASSVLADTHYVAQNGQTPSGTYGDWDSAASNIQDAITVTAEGDTVLVGAGHYTLPPNYMDERGPNVVWIDKPLNLLSSSGPATTSIDGGGLNRGIKLAYITSANLSVISGFTISNCFGGYGAGIYSRYNGAGSLQVQNCVISDNIANYGGGGFTAEEPGLYKVTLSNCVVRHNLTQFQWGSAGGGIQFAALVTDCLVENNCAANGAGIKDCPTIQNCTIRNNTTLPEYHSLGGGVDVGIENCTVRNCLIYNNHSSSAGGGISSAYNTTALGASYILESPVL